LPKPSLTAVLTAWAATIVLLAAGVRLALISARQRGTMGVLGALGDHLAADEALHSDQRRLGVRSCGRHVSPSADASTTCDVAHCCARLVVCKSHPARRSVASCCGEYNLSTTSMAKTEALYAAGAPLGIHRYPNTMGEHARTTPGQHQDNTRTQVSPCRTQVFSCRPHPRQHCCPAGKHQDNNVVRQDTSVVLVASCKTQVLSWCCRAGQQFCPGVVLQGAEGLGIVALGACEWD
jgi:hypothetical protein